MSGPSVATSRSLSDLLSLGQRARSVAPLRGLDGLRRAAERIEVRWPDMAAPDEQDREAILRDLAERLATDHWAGCRVSRVCAGIRAAFDHERRDRVEFADLRQFLFDEIAAADRRSVLAAALAAYIETFTPGADHTLRLARALNASRTRFPPRIRMLSDAFPSLFEPDTISDEIAATMAEADVPYRRLQEFGFRAPHGPGLMDHAHLKFVAGLAPDLDSPEACDRLIDWLKPSNGNARRVGAAEAIEAILKPWISKRLSDERQSQLTRRLIDMYGDPRRNSGYPWQSVGEGEKRVFMRWLIGENLRLLFDAITDTNDSHMWAERRNFYLGLHRQERIDDATVAFAPAGARQARRLLNDTKHDRGFFFSRQVAGSGRANTSLLILKIGNKIIVDGSHSYKVHVFQDRDPNAPRLDLRDYDCEDIRRRSKASRSHIGDWQGWVLMRI